MEGSTRHMISATGQWRHRCSTLLANGDPTTQERLHQGVGMLHLGETGHWWCDECKAQYALMEWGAKHDWPALKFTNAAGRAATLSRGEYLWTRFCQLSGTKNVEAALASARKQED